MRLKGFSPSSLKVLKMLLSGVAPRYNSGGCNATYYVNTKRHLESDFVNI